VSESRPRAVDRLGEELERVARSNLATSGGLRLAPRRLSVAVVLVGLLIFAAAATAAVLLIEQGPALAPPHVVDLQSNGVPLPGSVRLAGLDAPDPDASAARWDIRISRTRAGETCTAVGQVLGRQFGIVGLDHVFRVLPLGGVDSCGADSPAGPVLAGARVFAGAGAAQARTVVNGVAGDGARSVTAYGPGGARALRLGPRGSFITVYRGYVEDVRPRIVVVGRDGRSHTVSFAQSSAFETADPAGGSPWRVNGEADLQPGAYADENCAQAHQEPGRTDPSRIDTSLTPEVCGRLGRQPLFVLMQRFVPGSGERTGWPWGNNPARTLVYGAAAPRVASLTLADAGAARSLAIDPRGGVFLAVLDGHIDPRSLTLTAHLRNGQSVTYTHSANLLTYEPGRDRRSVPEQEPPVPAYRSPLAAGKAFPAFEIPLQSSVRETLRAADPAGGAAWALRSWQALPSPHANFGGGPAPARFTCIQVGVDRGGTLVEPRVGSPPQPLAVGEETPGSGGARCNAPKDLLRIGYMLQDESYLDDPYTYAPRPTRTVLSGELPAAATDPVLLGVGPPRRLSVDANHGFLVVLPGRDWGTSPHITYRLHGRTAGTGRSLRFPLGAGPFIAQARAPDPDGGAPWGFAATKSCSTATGRIIEGRLVHIDEQNGVFSSGPSTTSASSSCATRPSSREPPAERRKQVRFDLQQADMYAGLPGQSATSPTAPEIQRRTLPGRTIITGIARADVVSVTLSTPRDVRTLRPSGPLHVLIAVYDGEFFRGAIVATIRLRDGRTVTEPVLNGLVGPASEPPTPSLTARLRSTQSQLADERRHPHPLPRFAPRPPSLLALSRVLERRIAYVREHPGILPGE
jgi:hypothetical protein